MLATVLSLTLSAASPSVELVLPPPAGVDQAPGIPLLPSYMPRPIQRPEGVFIPKPGDLLMRQWVDYMGSMYPSLCQQAIDNSILLRDSRTLKPWQMIAISIGVAASGVITGVILTKTGVL